MVYQRPDEFEQDTTYRSQGVHKNRDTTAKMSVDAIDRDGVSDSQKQEQAAAAAAAAPQNMEDSRTKITVDERIGSKPQKDLGTEVRASGFKAEAKAGAAVEAPGYNPPSPGKGTSPRPARPGFRSQAATVTAGRRSLPRESWKATRTAYPGTSCSTPRRIQPARSSSTRRPAARSPATSPGREGCANWETVG